MHENSIKLLVFHLFLSEWIILYLLGNKHRIFGITYYIFMSLLIKSTMLLLTICINSSSIQAKMIYQNIYWVGPNGSGLVRNGICVFYFWSLVWITFWQRLEGYSVTYGVWNGVVMSVLFSVSAVHLGFNISKKQHLTLKAVSMDSRTLYICV